MTSILENHAERSPERLLAMRQSLGMTQAGFGGLMGIPFRTYQDLEGGQTQVRAVHMRAAEMAMIVAGAIENDFPVAEKLPDYLKIIVKRLAEKLP